MALSGHMFSGGAFLLSQFWLPDGVLQQRQASRACLCLFSADDARSV